jgi:hypothetical protein
LESTLRAGQMVTFALTVSMANVTNFGTGNFTVTLPVAPSADTYSLQGICMITENEYMIHAYQGRRNNDTLHNWNKRVY